jgi:hypothetical protein
MAAPIPVIPISRMDHQVQKLRGFSLKLKGLDHGTVAMILLLQSLADGPSGPEKQV